MRIHEEKKKRLKVIACEVLAREIYLCAARSKSIVDVELLSQGLHDLESQEMLRRVQEAVEQTDPELYSAVAMGFALCNNGLVGLKATSLPVIVPRAHDCITLFLGSKEAYGDYFFNNPGTYFMTTGWNERDKTNKEDVGKDSVMRKLGLDLTYEQYVEQYGEDNANYILETLGDGLQNYTRFTYIQMGLPQDKPCMELTREESKVRGWEYHTLDGDMSLLQRLMDGVWNDEEFLILDPGESLAVSSDERIITKTREQDRNRPS